MTEMARQACFCEKRENLWGLYPGVAKNVVDDEGRGRITVVFDWIERDYQSEPAHVAQIYAGGSYGAVWIPEEGDQVVVAFLNGQLKNPVVLGSIYSKKNHPLKARSKTADPKLLQTKGGNYLLMEDMDGKRVELADKDAKHKVVLDTEARSVTIESSGDVTIEAKAQGNLTLKAGGSITIEAGGTVTVSGTTINLN
jgi:uncharacterized protein involved in type VI secretion and phage assembly